MKFYNLTVHYAKQQSLCYLFQSFGIRRNCGTVKQKEQKQLISEAGADIVISLQLLDRVSTLRVVSATQTLATLRNQTRNSAILQR